VIGIVLLVSAAVEIVELARHHDPAKRIDRLIATVALAVAGGVVLVWPEISQLALLYVVGISAVVFAFAETAALTTRPHSTRERWLGALSSVVAFVFGIAVLGLPGSSLATVIDVLGVYLVVIGALRLLQAADAWRRHRHTAG